MYRVPRAADQRLDQDVARHHPVYPFLHERMQCGGTVHVALLGIVRPPLPSPPLPPHNNAVYNRPSSSLQPAGSRQYGHLAREVVMCMHIPAQCVIV